MNPRVIGLAAAAVWLSAPALPAAAQLPRRPAIEPQPRPAAPVGIQLAPVQPTRIRGFADLHTHQFANLAFGGLAVAGAPYQGASLALRWCDPQHGPGGTGDVMGNLLRTYETGRLGAGHLVGGYPQFDGWPHWSSISHQQMWEEWLRRAHRGGLQLMVMHAVNNEHFCRNARRMPGRTCNDQEAINLQLQEAKRMQDYIDAKSGGPGRGWYRIVYSPQEARQAIAAGQLAVVLGVEVDDPFPTTDPAAALQQLEGYFQAGVRHIFPIHFKDNSVGGASYDKSLQVPRGTPAIGPMHPYEMDVRPCAPPYRRAGGRCNALGLTRLGGVVLRGMMNKGMIIDVDHMSELAFNAVLSLAEAQHYPVVSGHTGFVDLAAATPDGEKSHEGNLTLQRLQRIRNVGGMVAVIVNQGKLEQIGTFRGGPVTVEHACGNTSETIAQAYLYARANAPGMPIGIATDMNAFFPMPGPRFGPDACPGGKGPQWDRLHTARVIYPFTALANGQLLYASRAVENDPSVTRTFDFNLDGLAHIGLLPDLVEDLRKLGLSDEILEPLMSSAEGYIQVWERALANRLPDESATCPGLRAQEKSVEGQLRDAQTQLGLLGKQQQECQAGTGEFRDGARKPRQCVDYETQEAKRQLSAKINQLQATLASIRQSKAAQACWF